MAALISTFEGGYLLEQGNIPVVTSLKYFLPPLLIFNCLGMGLYDGMLMDSSVFAWLLRGKSSCEFKGKQACQCHVHITVLHSTHSHPPICSFCLSTLPPCSCALLLLVVSSQLSPILKTWPSNVSTSTEQRRCF